MEELLNKIVKSNMNGKDKFASCLFLKDKYQGKQTQNINFVKNKFCSMYGIPNNFEFEFKKREFPQIKLIQLVLDQIPKQQLRYQGDTKAIGTYELAYYYYKIMKMGNSKNKTISRNFFLMKSKDKKFQIKVDSLMKSLKTSNKKDKPEIKASLKKLIQKDKNGNDGLFLYNYQYFTGKKLNNNKIGHFNKILQSFNLLKLNQEFKNNVIQYCDIDILSINKKIQESNNLIHSQFQPIYEPFIEPVFTGPKRDLLSKFKAKELA